MGAKRIRIGGGRCLGPESPAVLVAEIGQNHNGRLELAEHLVDAAAFAGVDAVKLTKRDLECDLSAEARLSRYETRHAFGPTYGAHRTALELSAEDYAKLARRARDHGLAFFSTACDAPSADMLWSIGVDAFKIASRDLGNLPLLEHVARFGRPMVLSTGMSNLRQIDAAADTLRRCRAEFVLLQCTSLYPAPYEEAHLRSMGTLAARYRVPVGFSDHTPGILLPPVAVAMGAVMVEKHLTLDRSLKGTDHACSLEPEELRQMVAAVRQVEEALGRADKPIAPGVEAVKAKLGRSLVTRVALPAGTRIEEPMLTLKCPGDGLSWSERGLVVGRRLRRSVAADEKLSFRDVL